MASRLVSIAVASAAVILVSALPAHAASTWHAAPNGTGTDCTQANPCAADYALVTKPADGDTVVLAGGDYAVPVVIKPVKRISIEGATSGTPTRLNGGPGTLKATIQYSATVGDLPVHITDLQVTNQTGGNAGMYMANGTGSMLLERVRSEATGDNAAGILAVQQSSGGSSLVLRDSVGRTTGANSSAVWLRGPASGSASFDLRNVTADARSSDNSGGLSLEGQGNSGVSCGNVAATVQNSYLRSLAGATTDVRAFARSFGTTQCTAKLDSSHSNWRDSTIGNGASISSSADQHFIDALFANPAAGDYHELAGSPTIDAGVADGLIGALDLDHEARSQGAAPDIGADEFSPPAAKDAVAPFGSDMKFGPSSFVPDRGTSSISKARKRRAKGSTVSYKLSENATVAFTVQRRVKGHKKGKKCSTARPKHGKRGKRCTTFKAVKGSFSRASTAGSNSFHFTGHVGGKKLKPGRYRMSGAPTDAAGNHGQVFSGSFTILRR